ncbi:MAG: hypothetical protein ACI9G5_000544 [Paracoccaceae bacterium]|jgi:hypothetical protein
MAIDLPPVMPPALTAVQQLAPYAAATLSFVRKLGDYQIKLTGDHRLDMTELDKAYIFSLYGVEARHTQHTGDFCVLSVATTVYPAHHNRPATTLCTNCQLGKPRRRTGRRNRSTRGHGQSGCVQRYRPSLHALTATGLDRLPDRLECRKYGPARTLRNAGIGSHVS